MIDLTKNARTDERFHTQSMQPRWRQRRWWFVRRTAWYNMWVDRNTPGWFVSWWFWKLQWYHGSTKCDGTRTYMMNNGQLGDAAPGYVMTTTPKELAAFRWRSAGPGEAVWSNMGGS